MKTLVTLNNKTGRICLVPLLLIVIALSGCTLDSIQEDINSEITDADLKAASQIMGESLSDDNAGIISSLNDAVTTISEDGFVRTTQLKANTSTTQNEDDNSGRGRESNFSYSYDPATGTHTLTFERKVFDGPYSKSVIDTLKYIFTDTGDGFIEYPREQEDRIETIDFKGFRQGTITSPERNSFFTRQDTFLIDGISGETALLNIDGKHYGEGNLEKETDNGDILERSYKLQVNFLNIVIDKEVVRTNQSLERGVTGTLSWEMVIEQSGNGSTETKTIRGTVEMNGDGTALLRFKDFKKLFQINLDDGDVSDQENRFEGRIRFVNIDRHTFTLKSGRVVRITESTRIDPESDFTSLEAIAVTLESGTDVWAEGTGYTDGDVFVATRLIFETDSKDSGTPEVAEFEGTLANVNLDARTLTLGDNTVIFVGEETDIHPEGDLTTLEAVREAYELDKNVISYGKGIHTDEEGIDLVADHIRFDYKNQDEGSTDVVEFEDMLTGVNLNLQTVTLEDDTVILITEETQISENGDLTSLEAVREAYELDKTIITYGNGVPTDEEGIDLIAKEIRFDYHNN